MDDGKTWCDKQETVPLKDEPDEVDLLELDKLEAEIAKLQAEARKLGFDADQQQIYVQRMRTNELLDGLVNRVYHFNEVMIGTSVERCTTRLDGLVRLDATAPIEIVFNSPGGSIFDGFELYDHILALRAGGTPVDTTILGMGASMAGVVAQAGRVRRIGANAYFMIHEMASMSMGKLSSMKDNTEFNERLYARLIGILAARSAQSEPPEKLSVEQIRERADRRDWWLDSFEALRYGFVDTVLPSDPVA